VKSLARPSCEQLTRCFSAVAELLAIYYIYPPIAQARAPKSQTLQTGVPMECVRP